jgi:hypothetical protein
MSGSEGAAPPAPVLMQGCWRGGEDHVHVDHLVQRAVLELVEGPALLQRHPAGPERVLEEEERIVLGLLPRETEGMSGLHKVHRTAG